MACEASGEWIGPNLGLILTTRMKMIPVVFEGTMKVLLTGGAGYLGSVLAPILFQAGHQVCVLDKVCRGNTFPDGISVREADLFAVRSDWLVGTDAVIHLAACSSDNSADREPTAAWRNNVTGSEYLIQTCLEAGVSRFIQASTCSIYGWRPDTVADETTAPKPSGLYAPSKYAVEAALQKARSATFCPFILRKPTLFGWSPRMRTDLVVNSMLTRAMIEGFIPVHNPRVWRPVLHVRDAALAYLSALEAPLDRCGIYNVHFANYRLIDIACQIQNALLEHGFRVQLKVENRDMPMSYRVESEKIRRCLKAHPSWSVRSGVHEMLGQGSKKVDWPLLDQVVTPSNSWRTSVYLRIPVFRVRSAKNHFWRKVVRTVRRP
jgi:nucleoside-diphosphate-sugar epimerase